MRLAILLFRRALGYCHRLLHHELQRCHIRGYANHVEAYISTLSRLLTAGTENATFLPSPFGGS